MAKIYDCFPFFNELDILEIRLEILYDYVDYFIISECDSTFSGLDKPFYFEENKEKYSKYLDKIIHIKHTNTKDYINRESVYENRQLEIYNDINRRLDFMMKSPKTDYGAPHWCRDFFHKELIMLATDICEPDDIILFGDCDEIPNLEKIPIDGNTYVTYQKNMLYYIDLENKSEKWFGTVITKHKNLKDGSFMFTRDHRQTLLPIENGGWHLSWMGGRDRIMKKLLSWSHQEYNNQYFQSKIKYQADEKKDFFDRNINIEDIILEDYYPSNILDFIRKKFPYLIKNNNKQ